MEEIGIESSMLEEIKNGDITIDVRLGRPKYFRIQEDDILSVREDFWHEGKVLESLSHALEVKVTQVLYFENFTELFNAIDFQAAVPSALTTADAVKKYTEFYTPEEEREFGAIAFTIEPVAA